MKTYYHHVTRIKLGSSEFRILRGPAFFELPTSFTLERINVHACDSIVSYTAKSYQSESNLVVKYSLAEDIAWYQFVSKLKYNTNQHWCQSWFSISLGLAVVQEEATLHVEAKHLLETERVDKHSNPDIVGDERTLEKCLTQMASIRSQRTAEKTYEMQTLYGLKAVDNPMLSIGFSPFMGTPLEVLHTILLGLAKYMLKQFMPQLTNRMKEEVLACVNAFPHSGLRSKMFGNVCRYYNSFVGRDLKGWSQMSVFILSPYFSSDDRKVLLSFSKVFRIAYCNYFSPHLYHEWKSICENFVINVKHTMPELLNKPKVHLILHLVDCMVNLGPCSAFSAERCESFNATVRAQNIFSNRLAPSRDICNHFAVQQHLRYTCACDGDGNIQCGGGLRTLYSSPMVQHFFNNVTMRELHGDRSIYQPGALRKRLSKSPHVLQHVVLNTIGLSCATIEDLHRHDSSTTIEPFHCMEDSLVAVFTGVIAADGGLVHAGDFVELLCSETKYALLLTSCQLETGESFCVLQGCDEFVVNSEPVLNEYECPLLAITKRIFSADCSQIKQAVSIVHECSDSCTVDWGSSSRRIEREASGEKALVNTHDWTNMLCCLNVHCV
eukprot:Em0004g481a